MHANGFAWILHFLFGCCIPFIDFCIWGSTYGHFSNAADREGKFAANTAATYALWWSSPAYTSRCWTKVAHMSSWTRRPRAPPLYRGPRPIRAMENRCLIWDVGGANPSGHLLVKRYRLVTHQTFLAHGRRPCPKLSKLGASRIRTTVSMPSNVKLLTWQTWTSISRYGNQRHG